MRKGEAEEYVLRTEGLTKRYGGRPAVNGVSLHVKKGAVYGLIGKNGAGKTTFMKMVAGLARPDGGQIELFGSRDLERQRVRMGTLIEAPGLYKGMTARENLEVVRRAYGITERDCIEKMLVLTGLEHTGKKKAGAFAHVR